MTFPLTVVAGGDDDRLRLLSSPGSLPLREALASGDFLLLEELPPEYADRPWSDFAVTCLLRAEVTPGAHVFMPAARPAPVIEKSPGPPPADPSGHPESVSDEEAVRLAYWDSIERVASLLRADLPVLVITEKLVVAHLWPDMTSLAQRRGILLAEPDTADDPVADLSANPRQRRLAQLRTQLEGLKEGDVIVLPHLDLLCGGADVSRHTEARELVELLYEYPDSLVLAFADTSLSLPEVLAERFSARLSLTGLPPNVTPPGGSEVPLGQALVTSAEAATFEGFQPREFYKHIAGMNPVRLRQAMRYARQVHAESDRATVSDLRRTLLTFKAQQYSGFEIPQVTLEDIGGYEEVKAEIRQALSLVSGAQELPASMEEVRNELVPRGFIFHGPPGTGKTLFAKAIANELNATIQVVSGPEVIDMYVGESERKVRELFAAARRSAPSVIVFDEIDAITMQRSGRGDGGTRVGNSVVAQILTEMDGFRPEVPMLVIGTTNRIDIIDEALLRPSRFRSLAVGLPDLPARRAILRHHARRYAIDLQEELLELIAEASENRNGDELRSIMSEAFVDLYLRKTPPSPRRMGWLVGKLQQDRRQRAAERQ
ncbi:ATP-binding protein [Streptomyces sp. NPDC026659]|uniref:ATP-binding protein n=1 Tax=Streptomyces sp. NPDC026659 TaxID=3155123 RepID=UPI0033DA1BF6